MSETEQSIDFETVRSGIEQAFPFKRHLGITFQSVDREGGTATLGEGPELTNHVGTVHAGALFTAAEGGAAGAFIGAFIGRTDSLAPLVRSAEIQYLKAARGEIVATGRIEADIDELLEQLTQEGKVAFPITVELHDSAGVRVAQATFGYHLRAG